ncbi:serine hydrolase domain-containing protein [Nocardia sp. NPDC050378]|uniref:serine hydrolase domain-containing protein n=1 Tax=Nocardia sp. NPDC050378 TaxID=3155400 RepID=UPI0033DE1EEB
MFVRGVSSVQAVAEQLVANGSESALQIAVVRDGEVIVDVAVGVVDGNPMSGTPVDSKSLFPVFSVSKGVTTLAAYRAIARGVIGFDTPVAQVWPEFSAAGKGDIRFGEILDHTAGLARMPRVDGIREFCDWDAMVRATASQRSVNRGSVEYHALTFGWVVGETVRRALRDDRGFGEIVRAELLATGASDFWFGVPQSEEQRIVTVVSDVDPIDDGRPLLAALPVEFATTEAVYGRPEVRRACLPAVNGIGNAETLAFLYAGAASGSLIPHAVLEEGTQVRSATTDRLLGGFVSRGFGFYVSPGPAGRWAPPFAVDARTFGHPGSGGSIAWGDLSTGTGYAICRSRLTGDGWRHDNIQRLISELMAASL